MARPTALGSLPYRKTQCGFGYLMVLFVAVVLGIASATAYEDFDTVAKREREAQWLFVGMQYQQAINSYYQQSPNGIKALPEKLADLIKDPRFVSTKRHLRKLYLDPITGKPWELLLNEENKIVGVVSTSHKRVLQSAFLELQLPNTKKDKARSKYSDYYFVIEGKQVKEKTKIDLDEDSEDVDDSESDNEAEDEDADEDSEQDDDAEESDLEEDEADAESADKN